MTYNTGCKIFDEWFKLCDSKDYPVSLDVKLLNQLILTKIEEQHIYVDTKKVDKIIKLIEKYRPYKLAPVQKFLHCIPYTYYPNGKPVWHDILILSARGFGKNSYISDYTFGATSNRNNIQKYNVDIVATSEDQAKTSFDDIYETIEDNASALNGAYDRTKEKITFINTRSTIRYRTSNAKTKDGLRPGAVVFDEIHAYENYDNIQVFTSALGKVPEPHIFYITTEGYVRGCVLDDMKEEAQRVLREQDLDSTLFPFLARIDKFEEWEDPRAWIKANPMLPYLDTLQDEYKDLYNKAKRNAQLRIEFITKRLNFVIEDTTTAVADWEDIKATNQEVNWEDFRGCNCICGIDYASVRDFIGVGLLFKKDSKYYFKHHTFIVQESLKLTNFNLDIDRAKAEGLVTIIPGKVMDERFIILWVLEQVSKYGYRILDTCADDYRVALLKKPFEDNGIPITAVRSGPITHGKLAPVIEQLFADRNLVFGDDMMMRWYTNNVKVVTSTKGNKTYEKIEPIKRKTDGFMAFVHAMTQADKLDTIEVKINRSFKTYTY